jgi:hypothetical protein
MASPLKNGLFIGGLLLIFAEIGMQDDLSQHSNSARSNIFSILIWALSPLHNWGGRYFTVLVGLVLIVLSFYPFNKK